MSRLIVLIMPGFDNETSKSLFESGENAISFSWTRPFIIRLANSICSSLRKNSILKHWRWIFILYSWVFQRPKKISIYTVNDIFCTQFHIFLIILRAINFFQRKLNSVEVKMSGLLLSRWLLLLKLVSMPLISCCQRTEILHECCSDKVS